MPPSVPQPPSEFFESLRKNGIRKRIERLQWDAALWQKEHAQTQIAYVARCLEITTELEALEEELHLAQRSPRPEEPSQRQTDSFIKVQYSTPRKTDVLRRVQK